MSLGGITRDSIVGLSNLVHDDDDDEYYGSGDNNKSHVTRRSFDASPDNFFPIDDDGAVGYGQASAPAAEVTTTVVPLPEPERYSRENNAVFTSAAEIDKAYYPNPTYDQNYAYGGYSDYYSDDYTSYGDDLASQRSVGERRNVFCCLFAPWAGGGGGNEIEDGNAEEDAQRPSAGGASTGVMDSGDARAATNDGQASTSELSMALPPSPVPEPRPSMNIIQASSIGFGDEKKDDSTSRTPESTASQTSSPPMKLPSPDHGGSASDETPAVKDPLVAAASEEENMPPPPSETSPRRKNADTKSKKANKSPSSPGGKRKEITRSPSNESSQKSEPASASEPVPEKEPTVVKSILKVSRCTIRHSDSSSSHKSKVGSSPTDDHDDHRRHLFPTYEPKNLAPKTNTGDESGGVGQKNSIDFNPMARVLTIPSRKEIPLAQRATIWWQRCDYNEFKKTGRIISKAMTCGGSEIWLTSNNAWSARQQSRQSKKDGTSSSNSGAGDNSVTSGVESQEYSDALRKFTAPSLKKQKVSVGGDDDEGTDTVDHKWWCKFGHSRRGIEHIASSEEGRARQASVVRSVRMVLDEQRRQRASRTKDPEKIRSVAIQYTSWARDLSAAAGAADAEVVQMNFCTSSKSRAHYYAKRVAGESSATTRGGGHATVSPHILDENTHQKKNKIAPKKKVPLSDSFTTDALCRRASGFGGGGEGQTPGSNGSTVIPAAPMVKA